MSLTLDLRPEEETVLRDYANAEGMTPDRFIVRLLKGYEPSEVRNGHKGQLAKRRADFDAVFGPIHAATAASGEDEEEVAAFADTLVQESRAARSQKPQAEPR